MRNNHEISDVDSRGGSGPRVRWQFGLKTLTFLFVVVGLGCVAYRWAVRWQVALPYKRTGALQYTDGKWRLNLPHRSQYHSVDDVLAIDYVEVLDLPKNYCMVSELLKLKYLPQLKELGLDSWNLSDEHLAAIATVSRVEGLDLSGTEITAVGMQHLAGLPRLRRLNLQNCRIAKDAYPVLGSFSSVEELDLTSIREPGMTVTDLAQLRDLPKLRKLSLSGPQYSNMLSNAATLETLAQMPALDSCSLYDWPFQVFPEGAYRRLRAARPQLILEVNKDAVLLEEENPNKTMPLEDIPENVRL